MDNKENLPDISQELVQKLNDFFNDDLTEHIRHNQSSKQEMFADKKSTDAPKEIVVNLKTYIYEQNEKGETTAPSKVVEKNFFIPVKSTEDSDLIVETFSQRIYECITQGAK
jgi:predicted transcriptional regulator